MTAYYNENDPFAANWLRNLIKAGHIAPGFVDERSIIDVQPEDLHQYTQCHFFAGIGGWSYALRLAGWPDDRAVWTGSPPCQPFSTAGLQRGKDDARHLAPHWLELVTACRPLAVFGEQVAAAIRHGWIDDLQNALEREDYATGAIVLPACSVGAPHLRQRLWFTAQRLGDTDNAGLEGHSGDGDNVGGPGREEAQPAGSTAQASGTGGLANTDIIGRKRIQNKQPTRIQRAVPGAPECGDKLSHNSASIGGLANASCATSEREPGGILRAKEEGGGEGVNYGDKPVGYKYGGEDSRANAPDSFWADVDWLGCRDGKWRPVEPGTFPLVNGATARVGRLRGYGNAIVPQVAAQIIKAMM